MNPVVQTPGETVDECLRPKSVRPAAKTSEDQLAQIGNTVTFRVLEIKNVRRRCHEDAAAIAGDGRKPGQIVRVDCARIKDAVAIGVFQHAHPPWTGDLVAAGHVTRQLRYEQPSIFVKGHGNRSLNQRRPGNDLQPKAWLDLKRCQRLARICRGDSRDFIRGLLRFSAPAEKRYCHRDRNAQS